MTGGKQSHNTGKCPSGEWGQFSTKWTSSGTVIQEPATGAVSIRSKEQRLDKSTEQLTDRKRTRIRGMQTPTDNH